jgi:hypothetical protein
VKAYIRCVKFLREYQIFLYLIAHLSSLVLQLELIRSPRTVFLFQYLASFALLIASVQAVRQIFLVLSISSLTKLPPVDLLATTAVASSSTTSQPTTDFEILSRSLNQVSEMLDRVLTYVRSVLAGDVPGDAAIGRYLMDVLGAAPGQDDVERGGFNATLQVREFNFLIPAY